MSIEELLTNLVSASPLLMALAPFWYILKKNVTEDMVSKDELEKIIAAFRIDVEKSQQSDKEYLLTLDKRAQDTAKEVAEIRGKLDK